MNSKDKGHKKGTTDDIGDHCVNEVTLKIMTLTMQISVKK
jgi:hypothetical protein